MQPTRQRHQQNNGTGTGRQRRQEPADGQVETRGNHPDQQADHWKKGDTPFQRPAISCEGRRYGQNR